MYFFIVNPHCQSGRGKRIWGILEHVLKRENIEYESYLTERPGDARKFARKLTRCCQEPRVIVTVGGDGTMNEVLDGLLPGPMITLGYIPAGSGNDLGRSLGFSRRQVRCLRRILFSPTIRLLDYGVLTIGDKGEHRRFMVSSGIGMDAEVCCMVRENSDPFLLKKMGLGRLEYAAAGLMLLRKTRPVKGYVILDRVKKIEFNHIFFISAHIHPFEGGGFCLAPDASGSDGKLRVCVVSNERRRRILRMLISIFLKRRKKRRKGIRVYECREALFHLDRPAAVHADGEDCGEWNEFQVECIPRQIRMIV